MYNAYSGQTKKKKHTSHFIRLFEFKQSNSKIKNIYHYIENKSNLTIKQLNDEIIYMDWLSNVTKRYFCRNKCCFAFQRHCYTARVVQLTT